ncbi:MAG TPA: hypothetical protein DCQ13_04340 [Firmicutes bacterium]|jgi:hypothetical protein|nr:hypothetical protein [Bacillota bacterium]HAN86856.1 hypothetical protein [Bacillota bacterium]
MITLSSTGTPALFLHAAEAVHGYLGMVIEHDEGNRSQDNRCEGEHSTQAGFRGCSRIVR